MFSFHVDPDLVILYEKLTAQIGAWLGLGTQLCFEASGNFWVDIVKMQRLTSVSETPLDNGSKLVDSQLAAQKIRTGCI